jgi:MATE family multidrug resistance protein
MCFFLSSNPDHVGAAGMGFMFCNVMGYSLIIGSGAGVQPLVSQAFGANNLVRCGDLLQRQFAIHAVMLVFIAAVWLNAEPILLLLRQPSGIAALAAQFIMWRIAALPALALTEDLRCFLIAQRVPRLPMLASVASNVANIAGFAVLIPRLGFIGAPLAYTLANILQASVLLVCVRGALPNADAWPRWSLHAAFSGWTELLKLALPGGFLMLCEWWAWETNLFFAGLLCVDAVSGCVQLDVYPIVANTMVFGFMPNFGFSQAAGAMIGNALGANQPMKARHISHLALLIAAIIGGTIGFVLFLFRHSWGQLFSQDSEILALTADTIPPVALYIFLDNLGPGALLNILRGANIVAIPATIAFVSFYAIGIPTGLWLTFKLSDDTWGIVGLWTGLAVGMTVMVCSLLVFLFTCVDWHRAAEDAQSKACGCSVDVQSQEEDAVPLSDECITPIVADTEEAEPSLLRSIAVEKTIIGKSSYKVIAVDSQDEQDSP